MPPKFEPWYSARALGRELGIDHRRVARTLKAQGIVPRLGPDRKHKGFWTSDIRHKAPELFEHWKHTVQERRNAEVSRGEKAA